MPDAVPPQPPPTVAVVQLARVAADRDLAPVARLHAALSLALVNAPPGPIGEPAEASAVAALAELARAAGRDPWVAPAVLSAAARRDRAAALIAAIDTGGQLFAAARPLLAPLAEIVGARADGADIAMVIELATARLNASPAEAFAIARALGAGLRKAGVPVDVEKADALLTRAAELAADPAADTQIRADAAALLGYTSWDHHAADLLSLLRPTTPPAVQLAALAALDRLDSGDLAPELLRRWPALSPETRAAATSLLVRSRAHAP